MLAHIALKIEIKSAKMFGETEEKDLIKIELVSFTIKGLKFEYKK